MTILEDTFQTTGNATNRTLLSPALRHRDRLARLRQKSWRRRGDAGFRSNLGSWHADDPHPPGSSARFQFDASNTRKYNNTGAPLALPINVAKASATLSLDMTAEEAEATPFYANFKH